MDDRVHRARDRRPAGARGPAARPPVDDATRPVPPPRRAVPDGPPARRPSGAVERRAADPRRSTGGPLAPVPRADPRPGPVPRAPVRRDPDDLLTRPVPRTPAPPRPPLAGDGPPPGGRVRRPRPARPAAPAAPPADAWADDADEPPARPAASAGRPRGHRSAPPPVRRTGRRRPRTLRRALLTTLAATVAPGAGHIMLNRRRTGGAILAVFLSVVTALIVALLTLRRGALLATVLSGSTLLVVGIACAAAALAWVAVIARTWVLAQPRGLDSGGRVAGVAVVTALSLLVAAPLGYAASLANSSRTLLGDLFVAGSAESAAVLDQPRINLLLVGSDAGPDRTGARTDTMIVASVETATGRTTLFSLPRNIEDAPFPPGSPMAEEFPDGFRDRSDPDSGDYLLNAVYAYGLTHPELAPEGPTADPGLNLLHQTVSHMLGLPIDYYLELNMAGFAAIVDALGGVEVDVGPERVPIGGISPSGRAIPPTGYIEPGRQTLGGEQALAFARSRTNSTDYVRMGRQRCLIQSILAQKSPAQLLANFQAIARATTANVSTDIPQDVLPALVGIADGSLALESVAFDPNLPDPEQSDGRFNTADPNYELMREVVADALAAPAPATPAPPAASPSAAPDDGADAEDPDEPQLSAAPAAVTQSC